jgi:hypothetical protein
MGNAIVHANAFVATDDGDCQGERLHWPEAKYVMQRYAQREHVASGGKHWGEVNKQHDPSSRFGYITEEPTYCDVERSARVTVEAADAENSRLVREAFLGGMSIEFDRYARRWHEACDTDIPSGTYCPTCQKHVTVDYVPNEITGLAIVDRSCVTGARLTHVKSCRSSRNQGEHQVTKSELQELITKGITKGVAQVSGRLHSQIHKALSERYARAAKCMRNGDHVGFAKEIDGLARDHSDFAAQWDRASTDDGYDASYNDVTRERDKHPILDSQEKFMKHLDAVDEFYKSFGVRPAPDVQPTGAADVAKIFE